MKIIHNPVQMQELALNLRRSGQVTALVPTMGYFHQGHLSLMNWARQHSDAVIVSLFVNPAQFGPEEDLGSYPRDFDRDAAQAETCQVDYIFAPAAADIYLQGYDTWVEVPGLSRTLCGKSRPDHFRGVATIVCRLFNITQPSTAVFGEKDRQQLLIIKKMVTDLNIPVQIKAIRTFREKDGLAMSSRNAYLSQEERTIAPYIYKGLLQARTRYLSGEKNPVALEQDVESYYKNHIPGSQIDYVRVVDAKTMDRPQTTGQDCFMAVAVKLGRARLIDNIEFR